MSLLTSSSRRGTRRRRRARRRRSGAAAADGVLAAARRDRLGTLRAPVCRRQEVRPSKHGARNIVRAARSLARIGPRLVPYLTTDPSRFVVDAGLAQLINANCHVLKMSAGLWGHLKNHEQRAAKEARGFSGVTIRVHSF